MKIINAPVVEREGYRRYRRTIEDDPYLNKSNQVRRKFEFLREIVDQGIFQGFLNCGPLGFDTLEMHDDGTKWVMILGAEEFNVDKS